MPHNGVGHWVLFGVDCVERVAGRSQACYVLTHWLDVLIITLPVTVWSHHWGQL
jgi:hypothetical protein